ncbi:sortase [Cellulomonas sp. McL0617]|uniref:sortase n=1 Tax=Cellulomonas sp. McL0617 TaxID=3415675 RepID=UPI003CEFCE8A
MTVAPTRAFDDTLELDAIWAPPPSDPPRRPRRPRWRWVPRRRVGPVSPGQRLGAQIARLLALVLLSLAAYVVVVGNLEHLIAQDRLHQQFTQQLAEGTAPVSEGRFDDVLLSDGAPVAQLTIPQIGVDETVVEGTDSSNLALGPGHRRDTSLPGQAGVSVIMGRHSTFGGPFRHIEELGPGDRFTAVTGQGEQTFEVIGVFYGGDAGPASAKAGESRLLLETARGPAFFPTSIVRVYAQLISEPQPRGARDTTFRTLPATDKEMAGDTSRAWALVFALQLAIVVAAGAVWTHRRIGARQAWAVFVPLGLLAFFLVADQSVRMLPNLM